MPERKLKVGIVGCGGISRMYADIYAGLSDVAQVVAMADLVPELVQARSAQLTEGYRTEAHRNRASALGSARPKDRDAFSQRAQDAEAAAATTIRIYRDHEELLRDPEVEAMVLLTPPSIRGGPAIAAAEAGRHVFSQGPMARSVAEADAIRSAVEKAGISFHSQVGSRYARGIVHAQRAVASGLMGQIVLGRVDLNNYRGQNYFTGRWGGTWEGEGGTATFHHGRYCIDPFLWIMGSELVEVIAYASAYLREIETEDLSLALLKFANGANGVIQSSLLHHRNPMVPTYRTEVVGRDATLAVHHDYSSGWTSRENAWEAKLAFGAQEKPERVAELERLADTIDAPQRASEVHQSRLWIESILTNTTPPVPIDVPWRHVQFVRAVYKSQETHAPVRLPLEPNDPFYTFDGRLTHGKRKPSG